MVISEWVKETVKIAKMCKNFKFKGKPESGSHPLLHLVSLSGTWSCFPGTCSRPCRVGDPPVQLRVSPPRCINGNERHTCALDMSHLRTQHPQTTPAQQGLGVWTGTPVTHEGPFLLVLYFQQPHSCCASLPSSLLLLKCLDWSLDLPFSVHRSLTAFALSLKVSTAWYLGTYLRLTILLKKHQKQSLMSFLQKFII